MSDTTTELKRLRADLEVLERYWDEGRLNDEHVVPNLKDKIARLEAEQADPWREAKRVLDERSWLDPAEHREEWLVINYVNGLTAERDRLAARVAELESDSFRRQSVIKRADELCVKDVIVDGGMIRTITEITFAEDQYKVFCGGWVRWYDKDNSIAVVPKPLVVAKPDPDDPILDPARVLATASEAIDIAGFMLEKNTKHNVKVVLRDASTHQKPYRLKGASE